MGIVFLADCDRASAKLGEEVTVETFAIGICGIVWDKKFVMTDAKGVKSPMPIPLWVFMESEKGRPVRPQPQEIAGYGTEEPLPMELYRKKDPLPKERSRVSHSSEKTSDRYESPCEQ